MRISNDVIIDSDKIYDTNEEVALDVYFSVFRQFFNHCIKHGQELHYSRQIQGDSKRLLKVHVSMILIFFDAGDLKIGTEQLQNYTILYMKGGIHETHPSIFKLVVIFLVNFKKKPKFDT